MNKTREWFYIDQWNPTTRTWISCENHHTYNGCLEIIDVLHRTGNHMYRINKVYLKAME